MKIHIYLVSKEDNESDWVASYTPVKAFRSRKDAEAFIKKQRDPSACMIDMIILE